MLKKEGMFHVKKSSFEPIQADKCGNVRSFLLVGIWGTYNYGCEAIVRGTELMLHEVWPDARVSYASYKPDEDRVRLRGCNVGIIKRRVPRRYSFANLLRKFLSLGGMVWSPLYDSPSMLNGADAVLSIGGDLYTLQANGSAAFAVPKLGDLAVKRKVPYVVWGCSVGPFDSNPHAERYFKRHLRKTTLITVREPDSVSYLASMGITSNVVGCADPAFAFAGDVRAENVDPGKRKPIAINLSPLSLAYGGLTYDEGARVQAQMVARIIRRFSTKIILVPHSVNDSAQNDDDRRYLRLVRSRVEQEYQAYVRLHDTDCGYADIKKVLTECDLVIAARMHCAINAASSGVPALLLSYSAKSRGMCRYIYGHADWVAPLNEFGSDGFCDVVKRMLDTKSAISDQLRRRCRDFQHEARHGVVSLASYLGRHQP